jgi:tetratricopeptide (TPR) repeat protein
MRVRGSVRALVVALAVVSLATMAGAENKDAAQARELYEDGARLYNLGQYESAVQSFEQSYSISGAKPLLFNIAQAHRLAGPEHCSRALHAYETYLREDPQTSNRVEVEQRIDEMRACIDRQEKARLAALRAAAPLVRVEPPPPTPPTSEAPRPPHSSVVPPVLTGVGASVAVIGGILYWRARVKFNEAKTTCPCPSGSFSAWQTATNVSYGLMAGGGLATLAGLSWWVIDRQPASRPSYAIALDPGGISLVGQF